LHHLSIHFFNYHEMRRSSPEMSVLVISMGFLILYVIFSWQWTLFGSLSVGLIGIFSSYLRRKIDWLWMKFALFLGLICQNILLAIVFYLILFPVSLVSKLFIKNPLILSGKQNSYFTDVNREIDTENFEKPW